MLLLQLTPYLEALKVLLRILGKHFLVLAVVLVVMLRDGLGFPEKRGNCPASTSVGGTPGASNCYSSSPSANCGSVAGSGVSALEKQAIVDAHNSYRTRVASGLEVLGNPGPQPNASNMRRMVSSVCTCRFDRHLNIAIKLHTTPIDRLVLRQHLGHHSNLRLDSETSVCYQVWDDKLAATAQGLANTCNYAHDTTACRTFGTSLGWVGQNLYWSWSSPAVAQANWAAAIQSWYNEVTSFNSTFISPYQFKSSTGHYTQVVWADTYSVGCGYIAYGGGSNLYVCNYGPGGNVLGTTMYGSGTPCSCCISTCSNGAEVEDGEHICEEEQESLACGEGEGGEREDCRLERGEELETGEEGSFFLIFLFTGMANT
ncbi:unnamed protein product [Darwinula stevensoni]|uniref:SCP domain-containing protein n=1 Tax=Darwinula stevensoni TaxID=69355 RepID=A0A7R9ABT8_9CRUS|nr:unnamed protein product [Darwinula stevensoni]CAG0899177.1 unnamed protein product [Darwinula stevensoni]